MNEKENPSITDLRKAIFLQMEMLNDRSLTPDIPRARAVAELAQVVVNSVKVEVEFHAIMKGAIDLPFIENQGEVLPADKAPEKKPMTPMERTALVLAGGNSANSPWRKRHSRG